MMNTPKNIKLINDTDIAKVVGQLNEKPKIIHATNGTYSAPADKVKGTMIAGFEFLKDYQAGLTDSFLIAANSDISMKIFTNDSVENQISRALKVAEPLAMQNPEREVIVVFYDQETPAELYDALKKADKLTPATLHKWGGYGIGKNNPVIVGAENFEKVYAFPFFDKNDKPLCFNQTAIGNQTANTTVVDLYRAEVGRRAYIKPDNTPILPPV